MKDLCQYGNRPEDEWEILPWIPDPRPPFEIWVKPEQIAPFFLIPHHPYAISLLLKINDGFRAEEFRRLGLTGSSEDWERLARGVIREFEENNSGVDLFHFDSDEDVFCVYSQYIDDLMMLAKMIRAACTDETTMGMYLNMSEAAKQADIYTEALVCLRSILCADHPELQNWIDWLERDIQDWTQRREVAHHLRAYGGMGSFNDLPSMRGNRDYIFDFLKSVCYAFGHLYDKREGISPEALMEECLHDAGQASYHPRRELNRAIAQHLRQGDLQENLDRL